MNTASSDTYSRLASWFMRKTATSGVRRIGPFPAALSTDIGMQRDENQDRVAIARGRDSSGQQYILAALSDGIGGMKEGAACAAATLASLFSAFFELNRSERSPELRLQDAVRAANQAVHEKLGAKGGATLSAFLVTGNGPAWFLNVGDSRIYSIAGGLLNQLTVDDTIAGQLGHKVDADIGSNLLQFIGMGSQLEAKAVELATDESTAVLLTSDGIHYLDPNWLGRILSNAADPGVALRRLTETAKWCGGHDNASAALLVPHRSINELFSNGDAEAYEIWDPYGELQLLISRPRLQQGPSASQKIEAPAPHTKDSKIENPSRQSPPRPKVSSKTKRKRPPRKEKKPEQMTADVSTKGNTDKEKLPQLKIDFPHKAQ